MHRPLPHVRLRHDAYAAPSLPPRRQSARGTPAGASYAWGNTSGLISRNACIACIAALMSVSG